MPLPLAVFLSAALSAAPVEPDLYTETRPLMSTVREVGLALLVRVFIVLAIGEVIEVAWSVLVLALTVCNDGCGPR